MRITILAHGSRGDIQPYIALGMGLSRAGHAVRLAAPEMFRELVAEYAAGQVEFAPLAGDPTRLMEAATQVPTALRALPHSLRMGLTVSNYAAPMVRQMIYDARDACQDAGLVIHTLLTAFIGHLIARERGARDLCALVFPVFLPTTTFPNPLFRPWPGWMSHFGERPARFGPRYNYLTHREFNRVLWHGNRMVINRLRRSDPGLIAPLAEWPFGPLEVLSPEHWPAQPTPVLYGISPRALPCPEDWQAEAGGFTCARMTGYWFLDAPPGWQPPEGLERFLAAGPPPVCIGFGSLIPRDAARLAATAIQALQQAGQRGVLLSGWGGLKASHLPEGIYSLAEAPFEWLFPRLAGVVHHGGMGTTAAALRAGIPQAAVPFAFDQPFWARQIHALGVGPPPIPPRGLTAERLASAIREIVEDTGMRGKAQDLGEKVRGEDGVGNAVRWIEQRMVG